MSDSSFPSRGLIALGGMLGLFAAIYLVGMATAARFGINGPPTGEPAEARFGLVFFLALLVISGAMLLAFRWNLAALVRGFVILAATVLAWIVFSVLLPPVVEIGDVHVLALSGAAALGILLYVHPAWYVLDAAGVIIGGGGMALFGVLFGVGPVIGLLVLLAVYDAVSVYGTKHMLSLAEGAMAGRLPVMLIVPLSTRFIREGPGEDVGEDAVVIGLGDAVIPGILVISAAVHGPGEPLVSSVFLATTPSIGAAVGTGCGLVGLLVLAARGGAHAGLPLLNSGAIVGYLIAAALVGIGPIDAITP